MFDWNDEELTYIIWGEAGEGDDRIVPFSDQIEEKPRVLFGDSTKKEINQQTVNINLVDLKKPILKSEPVVELDGCPKYGIRKLATGLGSDSWDDGPDPSSSNVSKGEPDSMGATTSHNTTKTNKNGYVTGETAQFNKGSGIFENPPEGGEQDDFVDYGWANIGSFDDLDRMFSNSDTIFGDISVGNADELWPSCKDITGSPMLPLSGDSSDSPFGALRATIDQPDIKTPYKQDPGLSFASGYYDKLNEITFCTSQDAQASINNIEQSGGISSILLNEKTLLQGGKVQHGQKPGYNGKVAATPIDPPYKDNRQKRLPKGHKSVKKVDAKQPHGTWTSSGSPLQQLNSQNALAMVNQCNPLMLSPQRQQKHTPLASLYGNMVNQYPVLAQFHAGEGSQGVVPSGYEVNANSLELEASAVKPPMMTPKEKIEKLRQHQKMMAMLAIQKQQMMQFGNQASVSEHSSMEGGVEEPKSPLEQEESNTISRMDFDNCSVEESVVYQLQDTISKLDLRIRECIRGSLYRLGQSATQRQYPPPGGKDLVSHANEHESCCIMPDHDVETDTNPIDRTVAHLLFHRPIPGLKATGLLSHDTDHSRNGPA